MKALVIKNYMKSSTVYYNYGDDSEDVWHNFKALEDAREVSEEELAVLKRAVDYFNNEKKRNFTLEVVVIADEDEVNVLIDNLLKYEKEAANKAEKKRLESLEKAEKAKANAELKKKERALKKLAKELNITVEEVSAMMNKK